LCPPELFHFEKSGDSFEPVFEGVKRTAFNGASCNGRDSMQPGLLQSKSVWPQLEDRASGKPKDLDERETLVVANDQPVSARSKTIGHPAQQAKANFPPKKSETSQALQNGRRHKPCLSWSLRILSYLSEYREYNCDGDD